ncbi:hypothetical protein NVP2275O_406 [Vibrio phage 2.275.O._10N.286.54.E11]|nr:hypothetical protein NVP2275O_406 [Vibrio phage 2.275.O._10N.286.54.E11]
MNPLKEIKIMTQLSDLYSGLNGFNSSLYLSAIATTFGLPKDNVQYWTEGAEVSDTDQIRVFDSGTGGVPFYAPSSAPANPIQMGSAPDGNWNVYSAGTGGSGSIGDVLYVRHVATEGQTVFATPFAGGNPQAENYEVFVGGFRQYPFTDYNTDGTDITLTTGAYSGDIVDIYTAATFNSDNISFAAPNTYNFIGDGVQKAFILGSGTEDSPSPVNIDGYGIDITLNGVQQAYIRDWAYDSNTYTVTFEEAPSNESYIDVKAFAPYVVGATRPVPPATPSLAQFNGDGNTINFPVPGAPSGSGSTTTVAIDGVLQSSLDNYSYSSGILSFTSAPPVGSIIDFKIYASSVIDVSGSTASADSGITKTLNQWVSDAAEMGVVTNGTTLNQTLGERFLNANTWFSTYQDMIDNAGALTVGMSVHTRSYYPASDYVGIAYGGCEYIVVGNVDALKVAAGIQADLGNGTAIEIKNYQDVLFSQLGCLDHSSYDTAPTLQAYLDYFKDREDACRLRFELTSYYFHTSLEIFNHGNDGSVTIEGVAKSKINSRGQGSIIYGNTGNNNPVILIAGSENVNLEKFSIFSATGSLSSPSTIGIYFARTNTNKYCQFINLRKLYISLVSIPTVNNNYGSIGIYNYASETHEWSDVGIRADYPMIITTTDRVGIPYNDYFDNTGTESIYTSTNYTFINLQLYPLTNSAMLLDIVRDLNINGLLAYADADILKYVVEFYGILPNRRIIMDNVHAEKIRRSFRIDNPLYESSFQGKLGTGISEAMALVLNDGLLKNVEFKCFHSSNGTVDMIRDISSNESYNVHIHAIRETNTTNVEFAYELGTAVYNNLFIYSDYTWSTTNSSITTLPDNRIYVYGTDGNYNRGTHFRGTTAQRPANIPTSHEYFDTDLNYPIWWDGSNWRDATGTVR